MREQKKNPDEGVLIKVVFVHLALLGLINQHDKMSFQNFLYYFEKKY